MNEDANLLEIAKQGDVNAIETILNQQLETKNITAKVALKDSCLQVMLVSEQVPDRQFMAVFICKKITNLGIESIERLKIHGKQSGDEFPAWSQEFELAGKHSLKTFSTEKVSTHKSDDTDYFQPEARKAKKIFELFSVLNQHQWMGTVGVISFFIGLFLPIGSKAVNYLTSTESFFDSDIVMPYDELIIIILAIVSLVLILENNKQKLLLGSGLACFCFTLIGFIKTFQQESSVDHTISSITFDLELIALGWLFLFIGSELIILSSLNNFYKSKLSIKKTISLCTVPVLGSVVAIIILCS